jgi:exodeoxyribonuclease VII large subunit
MDDLFSRASPPPPSQNERKVLRVGELTRLIKTTLENEVGTVWVEGEVSNFIHHTSGHMYFALKDADGLIRAAMFRGSQRGLAVQPANGMLVRAYGRVSAYPQRSEFQLVVEKVEAAGKGSLQEQFEKLKAKLQQEGLFDAARKKKLPLLPRHIGIVTSPTGAAIRDMLQILDRRFKNLHIVLAPVRVQGEGAAQEIAHAIDFFNKRGGIDVLIVGRGGGSLEDLWAFNEELVARAIARSAIPTISAVGHEVDFTISDFVADCRAPTPSAAAELVVGCKADFETRLNRSAKGLKHALHARSLAYRNRLTRAGGSYVFREPQNLLKQFRTRIERLRAGLASELRHACTQRQQRTDELAMRLRHRAERLVQTRAETLKRLGSQLRALGPSAVLERGYSITRTPDGSIVRDAKGVAPGEKIETVLHRGVLESTVTDRRKDERHGRSKEK